MRSSLSGLYSALATPVDAQGCPDLFAFDRLIDFVIDRGVDGIVVGGGTAEYPHFDVETRAALAMRAARRVAGRIPVITCVGTSSIFSTISLAKCAARSGSDILLLPMPHFFRYSQEDMVAYTRVVCSAVPNPFLLYNLPSFAGELEVSTAQRLMRTIPNVIGIKDSSGNRKNLKAFAKARVELGCTVLVGDDCLLLEALQAGWNGTVSGIGCFVPELIAAVYRSYRAGEVERASALQTALNHLIREVVRLPIPWGVRVGLEVRGIPCGPMHVPASKLRQRQIQHLRDWLQHWASERDLKSDSVWSSIPA